MTVHAAFRYWRILDGDVELRFSLKSTCDEWAAILRAEGHEIAVDYVAGTRSPSAATLSALGD